MSRWVDTVYREVSTTHKKHLKQPETKERRRRSTSNNIRCAGSRDTTSDNSIRKGVVYETEDRRLYIEVSPRAASRFM